jgi:hypothetical protein
VFMRVLEGLLVGGVTDSGIILTDSLLLIQWFSYFSTA